MIRVLSYNIWFDSYKRNERLQSLIKVVDEYKPDVLCFQEMTPEVYESMQKQLPEYQYIFPNRLKFSYGSVIMSKHIITQSYNEFYPETQMGRNLLAVNILMNNNNITVATSHFESQFNAINTTKTSQYIYANNILNKLYDMLSPVIFCSDTNILKNEEKYFFKDCLWDDAYNKKIEQYTDENELNKFKTDNEYTYDTVKNTNLVNRNIKEIRSRIDRIVYKGSDILQLKDFAMIKKISHNDDEPSDHFGILADFNIIKTVDETVINI